MPTVNFGTETIEVPNAYTKAVANHDIENLKAMAQAYTEIWCDKEARECWMEIAKLQALIPSLPEVYTPDWMVSHCMRNGLNLYDYSNKFFAGVAI